MSATLRVTDFTENRSLFTAKPPPVIKIDARQFPVTVHFNRKTPEVDYVTEAFKKACKVHKRLPAGGILIFVTGQQEVTTLVKKLRKKFPFKQLDSAAAAAAAAEILAKAKGKNKGKGKGKAKEEAPAPPPKPVDSSALGLPEDDLFEGNPAEDDRNDADFEMDEDDIDDDDEEDDEDFPDDDKEDKEAGPLYVIPLYALLPPAQQMVSHFCFCFCYYLFVLICYFSSLESV